MPVAEQRIRATVVIARKFFKAKRLTARYRVLRTRIWGVQQPPTSATKNRSIKCSHMRKFAQQDKSTWHLDFAIIAYYPPTYVSKIGIHTVAQAPPSPYRIGRTNIDSRITHIGVNGSSLRSINLSRISHHPPDASLRCIKIIRKRKGFSIVLQIKQKGFAQLGQIAQAPTRTTLLLNTP